MATDPIYIKWNQVNCINTGPEQIQGQSQYNTQEESEIVNMILQFSFMSGGSEPLIFCLCFFSNILT